MSAPRILAIAAASGGYQCAIVQDEALRASAASAEPRGLPEALAQAAAGVLADGGAPDLVAVLVGPGSFTGLRASIALAQGIAAGRGIPAVGVTVTEALREALPALGGRALWVASHARPGRVFLDRGAGPEAMALADLPAPRARIAAAGDMAIPLAAHLAAHGTDVMLTSARRALARHVALVGLRRHQGALPPCPVSPVYVDAPEARLPAGGLRPPPEADAAGA